MNDSHKPTATFPNGLYSATQVRLYGLSPSHLAAKAGVAGDPLVFQIADMEISISRTTHDAVNERDRKKIEEVIAKADPSRSETWPPTLPGPIEISIVMPIDMKNMGTSFIGTSFKMDTGITGMVTPGVIYGYAYEGHCYDLPKPKIMLIPAAPRGIPEDDCGFKEKEPEGYRLWIVDKLDECVEIEVSQGFVEQLVLEANMPGRRSPSTYRATMALSHRSGRLTE